MMELTTSPVREYDFTICEGRIVVRSLARINALLDVWTKDLDVKYRRILADVAFDGTGSDEEMIWSTDVFLSAPRRLSELDDNEAESYRAILKETLLLYAQSIVHAPKEVRKLLYSAITYISEESVFCGDGRVVLSEWGVLSKDNTEILGMPYGIEVSPDKNEAKTEKETVNIESDKECSHITLKDNGYNTKSNDTDDDKKRRFRKALLWIILLVVLIAVFLLLMHGCKSSMESVREVAPDIKNEEIVISSDSINYVVLNRFILVIGNQDASLGDFVDDFRNSYPDEKKYILSNSDNQLKRLTLTFPKEEKTALERDLPVKFKSYSLMILPESVYKSSSTVTNDPALSDAEKNWYFNECGIYEAWDLTMGDNDVIVAIIDDGFDLNHPELRGRIYMPFNAVTHTDVISPSPSGHGTHVASTAIGNANNSEGTAGVAPNCKFMPIQVGDTNGNMSSTAIFDAVLYAISNKADVVNMSLGMYFGQNLQFAPPFVQYNLRSSYFKQEEQIWANIFELARQNNAIFVLAGGNENILIGIDPMSRNKNTIRVSATQPDRQKASFSNFGDYSTVSAPGVHIYNAVPGGKYTYMDGTSMAAPIVAGGCALLKSQDKSMTISEIISRLRNTGAKSPSFVGPIVNFAHALNNENKAPVTNLPLVDSNEEENEDKATPAVVILPENIKAEDLRGRWKSVSKFYSSKNIEVSLYLNFNGTTASKIDIIEPSGYCYSAPLRLTIKDDIIYLDQLGEARSSLSSESYEPYRFVIKPGRGRVAIAKGQSKQQPINVFEFNLIKI